MRARFRRLVLSLVLIAMLFPWSGRSVASSVETMSSLGALPTAPRLTPDFGSLPLSFEPNVGQSDPQVRFLTHGTNYTLFLTDSGPVMSLTLPSATKPGGLPTLPSPIFRRTASLSPRASAVVTLRLVGANPHPTLVGEDKLPGIVNYFIGNEPGLWHTHIPTYAQVRYRNVYPGIDLVYYSRNGAPEYDFVVRPGADPARIRLMVSAESNGRSAPAALDNHGNLTVRLPGAGLVQQAPVIYQQLGSRRIRIAGHFTLHNGQLGLRLAAYDQAHPLVVDPTLVYGTYLGGSGDDDEGAVIAVDGQGNAYVTGSTDSSNFPLGRPFDARYGGHGDAYVTALSANGRTLLYSTYLGGSGNEEGIGIAVDGQGSAYVTGATTSSNFPIRHAFQPRYRGGQVVFDSNAFVTVLSVDGGALRYSTYLGGSDQDYGTGIAVDGQGAAYITGLASSPDFPLRRPFQAHYAGGDNGDAFVAALSADGRTLRYSTYLGGSGEEDPGGIAVDGHGNAYVTGDTNSANFPLSHPLQARNAGGFDSYVAVLSADGQFLRYSTYLGGSGTEGGAGIAVDGQGNAYVTGVTASPNFPLRRPLQSRYGGQGDAYVASLSADGRTLRYSTYLGGDGDDGGDAIAVEAQGAAYVVGATKSTNFPTSHPIQARLGRDGFPDAFVTALSVDGQTLRYSTYLGGGKQENGSGIAVDEQGNAYVTGFTESANFPLRRPLPARYGGGIADAFVAKISSR